MSKKEDKVLTGATLKLIRKEELQLDFKPQHRSTEIQGEPELHLDPFVRSPRAARSPERAVTSHNETEDIIITKRGLELRTDFIDEDLRKRRVGEATNFRSRTNSQPNLQIEALNEDSNKELCRK